MALVTLATNGHKILQSEQAGRKRQSHASHDHYAELCFEE